jgi:hypothetical protein
MITLALAGLGLPGSAAAATPPATVLTSCGTISNPGNYILGGDITASGTCFTITTGGIGLDLGGHKITGNGTGQGIRDVGSGSANIVITNGSIANFGQGIFLNGSNETIDSMDVENTSEGINIAGSFNTVTHVKANNNANTGVSVGSFGLGGCCSTLNGIQADNDGVIGISVPGGSSSGTNIEANGNGGDGVFMTNSFNGLNLVTAQGNGFDGIQENDGQSSVANSNVSGNGLNGIEFGGSGALLGHNLITNTIANKNKKDGIGETGNPLNNQFGDEVTNTTANQNVGRGIFLVCPSNALGNKASSNKGGNIVEDTSGGICTNVNNNAP